MPLDLQRQSALEQQNAKEKLNDAQIKKVEGEFAKALNTLKDEDKNSSFNKIIDDILDEDKEFSAIDALKNLDTLSADEKSLDKIASLYTYLTEVDELDSEYNKELEVVITTTKALVANTANQIAQALQRADKPMVDTVESKFSNILSNAGVDMSSLEKDSANAQTGNPEDKKATKPEISGKEKEKNTTSSDMTSLEKDSANAQTGKQETALDTKKEVKKNTKDQKKSEEVSLEKDSADVQKKNQEVSLNNQDTNSTNNGNDATSLEKDSADAQKDNLGLENSEINGSSATTEDAIKDLKEDAQNAKDNYVSYEAAAAEGLDEMPAAARAAFKKALANNEFAEKDGNNKKQLRMGDSITEKVQIYKDGGKGENTVFRDIFRMYKRVNVASAYGILKEGVDNSKNPKKRIDLMTIVEKQPNGLLMLKSKKDVEEFWKTQLKSGLYKEKTGFGGSEMKKLVEFTEMFFKITNKGNNKNAKELFFAQAADIALASDSNDKGVLSKNLLGTDVVSDSLKAKLEDPNASFANVLPALLGNYNFDKKVDSKDIGTITGQQMTNMYLVAKTKLYGRVQDTDPACIKEEGERMMVQNMVDMLLYHIDSPQNGGGKIDWKSIFLSSDENTEIFRDAKRNGKQLSSEEIKSLIEKDFRTLKTEKELLQKISKLPQVLIAYQTIFRLAGENASILFLKGKAGYQEVVERQVRPQEEKKIVSQDIERVDSLDNVNDKEVGLLTPEIKNKVAEHVGESYARALKELHEQVRTGKFKDGTDIPPEHKSMIEDAIKSLENPKNSTNNRKLLTINALGALVNLVKGEEGVGVGANITSEKLNDLISNPEKGWYNSINMTSGIYASPNGKPIIGMMLGLQGKKTWTGAKGGDHTFMYGAGVGAGMNEGKLVFGPGANLGYEEEINYSKISQSISKEKANYIGGILAASLTDAGISLYFRQDQYRAVEQQQEIIVSKTGEVLQSLVPELMKLEKDAKIDDQTIGKALKEKYPKSNPADIQNMAQNIVAIIKPYMFDTTTKAELEKNLKGLGGVAEGKKTLVETYLHQVMGDVAKLYALDWRNNQIKDNMARVQVTDFGVGKGFGIKDFAKDPIGTIAKNILPIYVGVGVTVFSKARYQELTWSNNNAKAQLENAYGVNDNDRISTKFSDKIPHMNLMLQEFVNAANAGKEQKNTTDTKDVKETQTPVEYFTVSSDGKEILIDPAVFTVPGMNIHIQQDITLFAKYENGKLRFPNKLPVMFHSTNEGTKMRHDLVLGNVGTEDTIKLPSFDKLTFGDPTKVDTLGSLNANSPYALEAAINKNEALSTLRGLVTFTTYEKLKSKNDPEYKKYENTLFVKQNDLPAGQKINLLPGVNTETKEINGIKYVLVPNASHALITFEQDQKDSTKYIMTVKEGTGEMKIDYKGFSESSAISTLKENIDTIVTKNGVKDFVEGAEINKNLLSDKVHLPQKGEKMSLKDKIVYAIQAATIADTKGLSSNALWQKAADLANALPGNDKKVFQAEKDDKGNITDVLKHSLRYLNAKMAVTSAARDRDAKRYNQRKDQANSDIIKGNDKETTILLEKLYKEGSLSNEENKTLLEKLGKKNRNGVLELNIAQPIGDIMNQRENKDYPQYDMMKARLTNEGYTSTDITTFKKYRNESANKLGGREKAQVYSGKEMKGAIGMVFGYEGAGKNARYDEKFVVQPNLATKPNSVNTAPDSYVSIDNKQMRKHFLNNLKTEEGSLLDSILKPLVEKACGEGCYEGENKAKAIKQFIDGMIDKGAAKIMINGKSFDVKADFGHAFYNECFNETIVMNNVQVVQEPQTIKGDSTVQGEGGFYSNVFNTVGEIVRDQKKYTAGILEGDQKPKQEKKYESGSYTGDGNSSGSQNGETGPFDGSTVGDIDIGTPVNTGPINDIGLGNPATTQTSKVMNLSPNYVSTVGSEMFAGTSQNIKNKASDTSKSTSKKEEEKPNQTDTSKKDPKTTEK